ncbi:MAG: PAS domain-containing protein [Marmoricola sp.]
MAARPHRPSTIDRALTAAVLDQPEIGVAVCDAEGRLLEHNDALTAMMGQPFQPSGPEEWSSSFHLHAEDGRRPLAPEEAPLARALRGEQVVDEIIATRSPGGPVHYLRCNGTRIHGPDGSLAGAVLFLVDATATVQQRQALDALRERLVDTVNHELRTPASALRGHVELLEELREELPEDARWSVDALSRNLARMQNVLDRISELADRAAAPGPQA